MGWEVQGDAMQVGSGVLLWSGRVSSGPYLIGLGGTVFDARRWDGEVG
jgi:hypothetical protein